MNLFVVTYFFTRKPKMGNYNASCNYINPRLRIGEAFAVNALRRMNGD